MSRKMIAMLTGVLFLLAAVLVCLRVGDSLGRLKETEAGIQRLGAQMALLDDTAVRKQHNLARWYNWNLTAREADEGFEEAYRTILDYTDHMMGYLEIPRMNQRFPVYHGVEEEARTRGVGHLPGSAFPIGGPGNHTILMGTADFGKLREGDVFCIHIQNQTLVYVVQQVREVSFGQTAGLSPSEGEDLCTLITGKGFGADSRKILVRGRRAETEQEEQEIAAAQVPRPSVSKVLVSTAIGAAMAALMLPVVTYWLSWGAGWSVRKIYSKL